MTIAQARRHEEFGDVDFFIGTTLPACSRRPVIAVDGPVAGATLSFDHHATGESVNLLAIPDLAPRPATIATTMLDTDAVISGAVVLLRSSGDGDAVMRVWDILYEACTFCDHLVPSGLHPAAEQAGLGLHCWLKDRGFAMSEVFAWAAGEVTVTANGEVRPRPSPATRATVFERLALAIVAGIRRRSLPADLRYLSHLGAMEADVRRAIRHVHDHVTVLRSEGYLEPLAIYRVVDTGLVVMQRDLPQGRWKYTVGVHPRSTATFNLRPLLDELRKVEAGWGGRSNVCGSPLGKGSSIALEQLLGILTSAWRSTRDRRRRTP
jgi:hypothetical protein